MLVYEGGTLNAKLGRPKKGRFIEGYTKRCKPPQIGVGWLREKRIDVLAERYFSVEIDTNIIYTVDVAQLWEWTT